MECKTWRGITQGGLENAGVNLWTRLGCLVVIIINIIMKHVRYYSDTVTRTLRGTLHSHTVSIMSLINNAQTVQESLEFSSECDKRC